MSIIQSDDAPLWKEFRRADMDAFRSLYFIHFPHLYEYGMRFLKDEELVKDSIHDLFVKLWETKGNLADVTAVRPYLLVALRSMLFNQLRKGKRMKMVDIEHQPFQMIFSFEQELINKEQSIEKSHKLSEALNQLTPRQKEFIFLRYFEEVSYEDISVIMNMSVKAAYKLNARSLEALRNILNTSIPALIILLHSLKH